MNTVKDALAQKSDALIHVRSGGRNGAAGERHMTAVQLMIDPAALAQMARPEGIPSMQCEVLQYLKQGDVERA
jgi:hypothetical protein